MADVRIQQYPLKPVLDDNDYFLIADAEDVDVNGWLKYKKVKAEDLPTIVKTAEDITIAQIQAKIVASDLTLSKFYRITNSASGVSPLLVQAVSVNSVSYQAFDAANPLTTINYNVLTDTIRWSLDQTVAPTTLTGTGIVKSTLGVVSYLADNSANWNTAFNDSIVSAAVTGTTTKTLTLNQQDGGSVTASWTDDNTDAVTSVFGRTGPVVAAEGDYSLTQLSDVTITTPSNGQVLKYNGTIWVNGTDIDTGLTSVGLTMPSAFSVANSPLTANGTLAVTGAGVASQYVRGDGTLADFPTIAGGNSVSYYFNGGTNQGLINGNIYRELSKTSVIGVGADFNAFNNEYIANFVTDANDPALLSIPAGNWNFEMWFSASSAGGNPSFHLELYKYNGATLTLIASNSATPEAITNGTTIDLYTTALAVPSTILTVTDRLAIRVWVNNSSRTITLHTQNGHLCQAITTFSTGITSLNGESQQTQFFATGTAGNDFNILSAIGTHTFNIPTASATKRGLLSTTDWTAFDSIVTNAVTLATTQTITGTKTFSNATTKFYSSAGISPSQTGGSPPTNWLTRLGNLTQNQVLDSGVNSSGAAWFQNYGSVLDNSFNVIALNPVGGDVVVNRITSAGYKFDVNGTLRIANNAYLGTTAGSAVGIGTVSIVNSAILEMVSTTKGLLPPRMTTTQVNAISAPASGLIVYNTTLNKLCIFESATWRQITTTVM